jgi:plastocyanin
MSNETLFFICGIALALSAVLVSIVGLKVKDFPGRAMPLVILWFALLVGGAATFAVLHAKDEQKAKAAEFEQAGREIETEQSESPVGSTGSAEAKPETQEPASGGGGAGGPIGPGGTLQLAADPTELKFDKTSLSVPSGKVTIDFTNPSSLEHDVAIEQRGKEIATSALIAKSKTSVSAELAPGTYTFLCTVPGHAEAGMEGTLVVK